MSRAFHVFLLCSVLSAPILGSSNAHAFIFANDFLEFKVSPENCADPHFCFSPKTCITVKEGETGDRTPVVAFPCEGTFAQQWTFRGGEILGIGTTGAGGKCLDVAGGGGDDGTPVQLFTCNGTTAQQWVFSNQFGQNSIVNPRSGKCLDVGRGEVFRQATIRFCNESAGQRWVAR